MSPRGSGIRKLSSFLFSRSVSWNLDHLLFFCCFLAPPAPNHVVDHESTRTHTHTHTGRAAQRGVLRGPTPRFRVAITLFDRVKCCGTSAEESLSCGDAATKRYTSARSCVSVASPLKCFSPTSPKHHPQLTRRLLMLVADEGILVAN